MSAKTLLAMILGTLLCAGIIFYGGVSYGTAKTEKLWSATVTADAKKATELSEKYRALERDLQEEKDLRVKEKAESDAKNQAIYDQLRDSRTRNDGLRNDIAKYARASGAAEDTLAACQHRSEALGLLLDEALSVSEQSARDGEQCESSVRALLR